MAALSIDLVTLVVADYDAAIAFFVNTVGFVLAEDRPSVSSRDPSVRKRWVVLRPPHGGTGLLLARAMGAAEDARIGNQTGGRVGFFLRTDDFAGQHAQLRARGVRFLDLPRETDYGMVAVFLDCEGNRWDLIEPR